LIFAQRLRAFVCLCDRVCSNIVTPAQAGVHGRCFRRLFLLLAFASASAADCSGFGFGFGLQPLT